MAKAHKNADFVLGDGCRELSSAATSPAGCIWQQCARQQIAATYRRGATPGQPARRGILPRDGSRSQRAGDSDVGANDKGAGDDPSDWVDAH